MPLARLARSHLALWALALLTLGACAKPKSYPITVEVPAADVATPPASIVVQTFKGGPAGAAVAEAVRNGIAQQGFVRVEDKKAEAVMKGSASVGRIETAQYSKQMKVPDFVNGGTTTVTRYYVRKRVLATVTYSLNRGASRIAGNNFSFAYDQEWSDADPAKVAAMAPSDDVLAGTLMADLAGRVVAAVTPHKETRQLDLETGGHEGLAQGIVYMQHERFDQADAIWKAVLEQTTQPKDRAAAYYNLGVIHEARKSYETAFAFFREADAARPAHPKYVEAMTRVEKARADYEKVLAQSKSQSKKGAKLPKRTQR